MKTHFFPRPHWVVSQLVPIVSVAAAASIQAQEVFTNPAGYVKLGNTAAGADAVGANTDVYLSIPLETRAEQVGTVSATTADSITFSGSPGWETSPAQWAPNPTPFCVIVTSGTENGLRAVISTNTADTLTVSPTTTGALANVSVGDSVVIRECWTLGTFFASANLPDNTQLLLRDETTQGTEQPADQTYFFGGGIWRDSSNFQPSDDVILHPGETFVLRSSSPIPSLIVFGDVSDSSLRNSLVRDGAGPEDLFLASMSPVPTLLSTSNFPAADGDQLLVYSASESGTDRPASTTFFFGGGVWRDNQTFVDVSSSLSLEPGVGYVVRRASNSPTFEEWTEVAPF